MKTNLILQDIVLNQIRRDKSIAIVVLSTGQTIKGVIRGFDNFTLILDVDEKTQIMVYKHNLVSVQPTEPVLTDARMESNK